MELQLLIEAVESGEIRPYAIDELAAPIFHHDVWSKMGQAYGGSLDAAKAFHDALLPGWDIQITTYEDDSFEASVSEPTAVKTYDGVSRFMARAWLIAILKAYQQVQIAT